MSVTISGGAYQRPDGSWVNAAGQSLKSDQVAQFEKVAAQRQQQLALAEQQRMAAEASSNPISNALLQALGLRSTGAAPAEQPRPRGRRGQPASDEEQPGGDE